MRIAVLCDRFPALSETFIENQILSLVDLGIEVVILASGRGSTEILHAATRRILAEVPVLYLPAPRPRAGRLLDLLGLLPRFHAAGRVLAALRRCRARPGLYDFLRLVRAAEALDGKDTEFDHVFCHFAQNGSFGVWLRDLGLIRGRIVTFCHGYDFSELVQTRGSRIFERLFARGDLFVANTNYTRRRLLAIGAPEARTLTLPVGLFPERFRYRLRHAAPVRPVRFLSIGRLVEKKGHAFAIRAFRQVLDAGVTARLGIIGDGPLRGQLEALIAELDLANSVTLLGKRSQEEVARLADSADLFVLASTTAVSGDVEGQGLVLQEAQIMGLPVICTDHNGFPEGMVNGESGVLVPEGDAGALAAAMIELARHPERWAPMGRCGHGFVRDRFDQNRLTAELLQVLGARLPASARVACEPMASRAKLEVINGLRGCAILAVIWHHLFGLYFKPGSAVALDPMPPGAFYLSYGWIGVQLFFVLSGFVLYLPYAEGRARLETRTDAWGFYRRRAARLLPLYYFTALICLVLNQAPPTGEKFLAELVSMGLVLFPFVSHGFEPHLNPPLWSLGVEIWFSVLFPLVVPALQRLGAARFLLLAAAIGLASRGTGLFWPIPPLTMGLTANLDVFAAGMVLARWHIEAAHRPDALARPRLLVGLGALTIAAAIATQAALPAATVLFPDAVTIGFSLITAGLLARHSGLLYTLLANRPIQLIGMMCFSLYVWHQPLLRHVFEGDIAPLDGLAETLPVYLAVLAATGALSYCFIEFGRVADWRSLLPSAPLRRTAPAIEPAAE